MKIEVIVPDGISNEWAVESFEVQKKELSEIVSMFKTGRGVPAGNYKRLMRAGTCVMSNTPDECNDFSMFVHRASGTVLVNGLGLGVLLNALLQKEEIKEITVIEKSEDVIKLVAPTFQNESRVKIIHADAFEYKPEKGKVFDAVWHDIWDYITTDNLEEMAKLHRKYGKRAKYQASWGKWLCQRIRKRDKNQRWGW